MPEQDPTIWVSSLPAAPIQHSLTPAATDDYWYTKVSQGTTAGVRVDEDVALNYSACWAATRLYAETTASLPLWIYERLRDRKGKQSADDHPLFRLLHTGPNPEMDAFTFWESRIHHVVNWGNGFAEIERAKSGRILNLWPIHPSRVKPDRTQDADRSRIYRVRNNNGRPDTIIPVEDMFHVVGVLSEDGLWGKGVIAQARESIGLGLSTERYGSAFFGNGGRPGGVLETAAKYNEVANRELRDSWKRVHGGPGQAHEIAILWNGLSYKPIDIPPEDAQFLETRQHNITEIARWYRLPVHLLAELTRSTNNNIEAENLGFVIHSLRPLLVRIEKAIARQLLGRDSPRYFAEFLLDALLRGDMATRTQALSQQFLNGAITLNEWRAVENRNPTDAPGGDEHFVPLNMTPLSSVGAHNAQDEDAEPTPAADRAEPGELLDVPDFRQNGAYDCGAAATHSVCAYFGVGPETEEEFIAELGTTPADGTRPGNILALLTRYGLAVTAGQSMDLDDLAAFHDDGRPVICPIQAYGTAEEEAQEESGHYVVVIGRGMGMVFIQDPSAGRQMVPEDEFLQNWHDRDADANEYNQYGIAVGRDVLIDSDDDEDETAGDPEPETNAETPPTAENEPEADDESGLAMDSEAIRDAWKRMRKIEANERRRARKQPERYRERMESFYQGFDLTVAAALTPAVADWLTSHQQDGFAPAIARQLAEEYIAVAVKRLATEDFDDAPTDEIHGLRVRIVNAAKVRDSSQSHEEFGNFGIHAQFPDLIPEGEVWISDETKPDERHFFVDNAALMQSCLDKGESLDEAKAAGLAREKRARNRAETGRVSDDATPAQPPDDLYVSVYKEDKDADGDKVEVWLVDGEKVRDLYRTQFHESGHGYVYDWIPRDEIWLEAGLSDEDKRFDLLHEETERTLMKDQGMDYDSAHEEAAKAEFKARQEAKTK